MTAEDDAGKKINLVIRHATGEEDIQIKCKITTPFQKIYGAVAKQKGITTGSFGLLFDGEKLNPEATPKMLEMEEEEQLDFVVAQIGGGRP
ncbi:hypothetical protein BCR35DRAFT_308891 [Leucosporidium creatinivorum]|uniref:Ubiquitin-like domain-containing protein n=1 Tax=Leucosporidium creatinivorum TaxID=106004 RepID=A0A1Y2DW44_9BASI|nr:hypothetical protein BCR35DRAFT_308891 [Leucosporidium creatinivorum]